MAARYVYSLNGEDYTGAFESRHAAETAAIAAAGRRASPPATVFVARATSADANAAGHAHALLARMAGRARQDRTVSGNRYLANLSSPQIHELDAAVENAIRGWLDKHHLIPTVFGVEAISEHPVPQGTENDRYGAIVDEVHDLGVSETAQSVS